MSVTPDCPECGNETERFEVEGEDIWRCPKCGRRTYGTGSPDDDDQLPPYSEADEDGGTVIYHGTGEVDIEATAELAAQDGPTDEDDGDRDDPDEPGPDLPAPPEPGAGHGVRATGLDREPGGERGWGDPQEWGSRIPTDLLAADRTTATFTHSNGEAEQQQPGPPARTTFPREDRTNFPGLPGAVTS
ncbi:zf-TFIIB domain-containing protein [Streptomyces turgidiscabies]|uniref:TFIIB-type zinc ribbon-containing protein n=1 Tax=Streptomyces turgidiscabies TaxID=85558 RepID=UPI0038F66947